MQTAIFLSCQSKIGASIEEDIEFPKSCNIEQLAKKK